ncbi:MAG: hypothetical protein JXM71_06255 [Spirochaetales bacterium]|nr:hypothetical protein [Spirochaetales bacterium]
MKNASALMIMLSCTVALFANDLITEELEGNVESVEAKSFELVTAQSRTEPGVMLGGETKRFDADGNIVELILYADDGVVRGRLVETYDGEGKLVELAQYTTPRYSLSRDELSDDGLARRTAYEYDARGSVAAETWYSGTGNRSGQTLYAYEYDVAGNWIRCTCHQLETIGGSTREQSSMLTIRTISYYPAQQ